MLDLPGLRVGFVPMSKLYDHPFDRRNFIYYARKRDIKYEIAERGTDYDVIVLSPLADVSVWSGYRGSAKLIYLLVDSYLAVSPLNIKGALRGVAKYIGGQHKRLKINYSTAIQEMCSRADAVVCTTLEQKEDIQKYCKNVHVILEFNLKVAREIKSDYSIGKRINLVWEGQPENIYGFIQIKEVLTELRKKYPITLHIITDLERRKYMNIFRKVSAIDEVRRIFNDDYLSNTTSGHDSLVYLYQWNLEMLSRIITGCDIAIIPLDISNPMMSGKPENKLVLFWRMGMPTIVSATPAYERVMARCGLKMCCRNNSEWQLKLEEYIVNSKERQVAAMQGKVCADTIYSEDAYLEQWDRLFQSVLDR